MMKIIVLIAVMVIVVRMTSTVIIIVVTTVRQRLIPVFIMIEEILAFTIQVSIILAVLGVITSFMSINIGNNIQGSITYAHNPSFAHAST